MEKPQLQYTATPENAAKIAELMLEPAMRISKARLDYTPASLKDVDRFVRKMWREIGRKGRSTETVFGFGCYVGEVILRESRGRWPATEDTEMKGSTPSPMVLELSTGYLCDPLYHVHKRFWGKQGENLFHYYRNVTGTEPEEEPGGLAGFLGRLRGRN